ncbi:hypothetical protein POSPLADRAFT_1154243 [Postia placenta MAD-698-R-SB12]|uniref:Aminoglycoside phosphotransferase domain-containing protein n=1 Tax=Postia placenta MAD-698-R-SB12 TaxID=670580 RepID=A0A1X6MPZ5_9APHY|nr:hypothetical protein POSPLADRAFT_1154243 [Postia placenta MAD-698-R-SB12]OSX58262.1 hypothetical protein POSPLADRAFT_1154243 [Postia placenta MAD-698-R-SB12]
MRLNSNSSPPARSMSIWPSNEQLVTPDEKLVGLANRLGRRPGRRASHTYHLPIAAAVLHHLRVRHKITNFHLPSAGICARAHRGITVASLYSDVRKEIYELCKKSPQLRIPGSSRPGMQPPPIFIISPRVIVKTGWYTLGEFEPRAMEIVRAQTSIPVPRPLRIFKRGNTFLLAMEYIKGRSLDWCWDDLSLWRKFVIAWMLRGYIRQLRRVRTEQIERQIPGPLTDDLSKPLKCYGPAMGADYHCGPFSSATALFEWLNGRLRVTQYIREWGFDILPFVQREPLVLVHGDLTPRNVVLGHDGKLWLIDWGSSGVYPPWFEAAAMLYTQPQPSWWLWVRRHLCGDLLSQPPISAPSSKVTSRHLDAVASLIGKGKGKMVCSEHLTSVNLNIDADNVTTWYGV